MSDGFWELTVEEHDKWMIAERAKISEIDAKRAKDRGLGAEGMENAATRLSGAVKRVLAQVAEAGMSTKDEEEDAERAF